jgi:2-iminoacetate synthase
MFSERYQQLWDEVSAESECKLQNASDLAATAAPGDARLARLLWEKEFGAEDDIDRLLLARSEETKSALFGNVVQAVVPIYVTSVCAEGCYYCNYRSGNKGQDVQRIRLSDSQLVDEAEFLIREKGLRSLELVYASDPLMPPAVVCRHVEAVRNALERHGGGLVGLSYEPIEESEYRSLRNAGLSFCVLWQETYDRERYRELHPGNLTKSRFEYRLDAFERMAAAGIPDVGIGILTGLAPWKQDWAMLMRHERYLLERGAGAAILGIPRLKPATGATIRSTPFIPADREFLATVALHNLAFPEVRPFVSTREEFALCARLAKGGGCLFTFNCTTIPGGYTQIAGGYQFPTGNYDAPVFSRTLRELGLNTEWNWSAYDRMLAERSRRTPAACS